jgi:hypothetical protein
MALLHWRKPLCWSGLLRRSINPGFAGGYGTAELGVLPIINFATLSVEEF